MPDEIEEIKTIPGVSLADCEIDNRLFVFVLELQEKLNEVVRKLNESSRHKA